MKIGKLAKAVGCTVETIRFYEKKGLLPPPARSSGNFRLYTNEHLQRLSFICYCRYLDISLDDIHVLVNLKQGEKSQEINALLDRHLHQIANHIHKLEHLRMHLVQLKKQCSDMEDESSLIQLLRHSSMNFIGQR